MVICKYYQAGRCRYGNNCKYEHIDPPGGSGNGNRGRGGFGRGRSDPFASPPARNTKQPQAAKAADEFPQWPLTAIGIKDACEKGNELSGDLSPEELRAMAYSMAPKGISPEVTQRESQMVAEHRAKVDALLRGGRQTPAPSNVTVGNQSGDPFANAAPASGGSNGFAGFGVSGSNAMRQPQQQTMPSGFGQPAQPMQQQNPSPFGAPAASSGGPFMTQSTPFGQPQQPPQQLADMNQNPNPPLSAAAEQQYSASQFGFAKVPETAPPPKFY